jgi:glycosyltransferase involved in cell wall biosynthesis
VAYLSENARRIRVAYCIDSFVVGGTELNAVRTAEALDFNSVELRVFHMAADGPLRARYEALNVSLSHVPIGKLYSPKTAYQGWRFAHALREWGADLAHTHDLYTNIFFAPWARIAGCCQVLASRRWWYDAPRPGLGTLNRICNRFADRLLANSPGVARLLVGEEGVAEKKVVLIPNFLDSRAFDRLPDEQVGQQRSDWSIPAGAFVLGTVARLAPVKNHVLLLNAMALLPADIHLILVGDGPSRDSLERAAAALGVLDRVHFAGELLTPVNLHQFFDVSVLCSLSEGFPNSIIEAMAAARPVIATPVGGVLDVVEEGVTGLLRPINDPAAMAEAIALLRADPALRRRLGEAGRGFVGSRYGQDQVIGMLMATYRSMSRGRSP